MDNTSDTETGTDGWRAMRSDALAVLRNLVDFRLRTIITTTMAPAIYALLVFGIVALNLFLTVEVFAHSIPAGLFWLLLAFPIGTIAGLIAVRVLLEALLSLFRIVLYMETLMDQLHTLSGQTESIADRVGDLPLPRIQFWRSRRGSDDGSNPEPPRAPRS